MNSDCCMADRTVENTRNCKCTACKRWWCANVPGYFYCEECGCVTLECMVYNQMCEECFDEKVYDEVAT